MRLFTVTAFLTFITVVAASKPMAPGVSSQEELSLPGSCGPRHCVGSGGCGINPDCMCDGVGLDIVVRCSIGPHCNVRVHAGGQVTCNPWADKSE